MSREAEETWRIVRSDAMAAMKHQKTLRGKYLFFKVAWNASLRIARLKREGSEC